ncbi:MAG: hypothetical protein KJ936_09380 [Proteobacteria bacterium]|nr:hypothetical protein [Pseudomonadota bacterium]
MTIVHDSKLAIGAILSSQELINTISGLAKVKFDRVCVELVCGLNESIAMGKEMESRGIDVT